MSLKMYVWHVHPSFLAVAQANSVEEARAAVLRSDLGESGDGSCPERDKAREFVLTNTPAIWYEVNAEFVLTDSAELREQEDYSQKLFKRVSQLEADLAAAREDVARMDFLGNPMGASRLDWEKVLMHTSTPDELRAAIDSARAGGGKEPIRASGDCICSMCGKRYGDHPMDKEVLSGIDNLPFLHVLCDGARVKL